MSTTTVEHIVLFSNNPNATPAQIDSMLSNLRSLAALPTVTYLTAVPVLCHRSSASEQFTHILHSRYPTKSDLDAYARHPSHRGVVKDFVLPICFDVIAVDWVSDSPPTVIKPGSAVRLTLVKGKAGERGKGEILEVMKRWKGETFGLKVDVVDSSYGVNFLPKRSKGYDVGMLTVVSSVKELDELEKQKEKVGPLMEDAIVVDFVVPIPASL